MAQDIDRGKLTRNILIGMLAGLILGSLLYALALPETSLLMSVLVEGVFDAGGQLFIKSLKLLVVPLVFVSLVCGASQLGSGSSMGRIGIKTIGLYLMTTAIAVSLALVIATSISPGEGFDLQTDAVFTPKEPPTIKEVFVNIFPDNPVRAMVEGNMLQIIVFALLFGFAITKSGDMGLRVRKQFEDWNEVIMRLVMLLMRVAPFGVFCLMISLFAHMGFDAIFELAKYFFLVAGVLLLHFAGTFSIMIRFLGRLSPLIFYRKMAPVMAYAFSTSSSNATLPVTLETVEHRLGVKNEVAAFTVPLGATINMDGTAIMQGCATVFIAQAYNIDISMIGYLGVILTATLASIGTAGVPGVGLITLAMVLQQVNLPVEGIALIIGVDRLLDMMRTIVNVTGDATVSTLVAKSEGRLDEAVFADGEARKMPLM